MPEDLLALGFLRVEMRKWRRAEKLRGKGPLDEEDGAELRRRRSRFQFQ